MTTEEIIQAAVADYQITRNEARLKAGIAALVESERKAGYEEGFDACHKNVTSLTFEAGARAVAEKVNHDIQKERDKAVVMRDHGLTKVYNELAVQTLVDRALAAVLGKDKDAD